jgi:hypothetical protein
LRRNAEQTEREGIAFDLFLKACPSLADSVARFHPANEASADVTAILKSGTEVDFQLGEWLDQNQTRTAVKLDGLRRAISKALRPCLSYSPRNFRSVLLKVKEAASSRAGQFGGLNEEFSRFAADVDSRWPLERFWHTGGYYCDDFTDYPALCKCIESAHFWPHNAFSGIRHALEQALLDPEIRAHSERASKESAALSHTPYAQRSEDELPADSWIGFDSEGSAYASETAIAALHTIIEKKLKRYAIPKDREARLIVYYDLAVVRNTPYHDCLNYRNFDDVAREAARFVSRFLHDRKPPFSKIYLLKALWPTPEAFEIWPIFIKCK